MKRILIPCKFEITIPHEHKGNHRTCVADSVLNHVVNKIEGEEENVKIIFFLLTILKMFEKNDCHIWLELRQLGWLRTKIRLNGESQKLKVHFEGAPSRSNDQVPVCSYIGCLHY